MSSCKATLTDGAGRTIGDVEDLDITSIGNMGSVTIRYDNLFPLESISVDHEIANATVRLETMFFESLQVSENMLYGKNSKGLNDVMFDIFKGVDFASYEERLMVLDEVLNEDQ